MSQNPLYIPEDDYPYPEKPKEPRPRVPAFRAGWGCITLIFLLVVVLVGAFAYLWVQNTWLGETVMSLRTQVALVEGAAYNANSTAESLRLTEIALDNNIALLDQTATQSSVQINATLTANSALAVRNATQVALDYAATQAALQQRATQVELNFQQTRSALNSNTNPNNSNNVVATAPPPNPAQSQAQPQVNTPVPSTASGQANVGIADEFSGQSIRNIWRYQPSAWAIDNSTLLALDTVSQLLSQSQTFNDGTIRVRFAGSRLDADHYIVLNYAVANSRSYALGLISRDGQVEEVSLYAFNQSSWIVGLNPEQMAAIESSTIRVPTDVLDVVIEVANDEITVTVNQTPIFTASVSGGISAGAVGVQFPAGASLDSFVVES